MMIGIDVAQTIAKECPKYPQPDRFNHIPRYRLSELSAFQSDAEESVKWLVLDALRAALSYIEWLEANITAADNEIYGICISNEETPYYYVIASILEAKKEIREVIERLKSCPTSNR